MAWDGMQLKHRGTSRRPSEGALLLYLPDQVRTRVKEAVDAVGEAALLLSGEARRDRADASRQRAGCGDWNRDRARRSGGKTYLSQQRLVRLWTWLCTLAWACSVSMNCWSSFCSTDVSGASRRPPATITNLGSGVEVGTCDVGHVVQKGSRYGGSGAGALAVVETFELGSARRSWSGHAARGVA